MPGKVAVGKTESVKERGAARGELCGKSRVDGARRSVSECLVESAASVFIRELVWSLVSVECAASPASPSNPASPALSARVGTSIARGARMGTRAATCTAENEPCEVRKFELSEF